MLARNRGCDTLRERNARSCFDRRSTAQQVLTSKLGLIFPLVTALARMQWRGPRVYRNAGLRQALRRIPPTEFAGN